MATQIEYDKRKTRIVFEYTSPRGHVLVDYKLIFNLVLFQGRFINVRQKKNSENTSPRGRVLVGVRASGPRQTNKQAKLSIPPWSSIPRPQG